MTKWKEVLKVKDEKGERIFLIPEDMYNNLVPNPMQAAEHFKKMVDNLK